jgi:hypothetical protein
MRAFKFALIALFALVLTGGAFLSYIVLVPVSAGNVQFRLTSVCAMGTAALRFNDAAAAELEKLTKGSCGCLSQRLVDEAGTEVAAAVTEAARKLGVFGIKRKWGKGAKEQREGMLKSFSLRDKVIQEFSERYVKAANACEAEAA